MECVHKRENKKKAINFQSLEIQKYLDVSEVNRFESPSLELALVSWDNKQTHLSKLTTF